MYYSFLPIKSLPKGSRTDKLIDRSRTGVFVGYIDNTDTIYRIQAPNIKAVIKAYPIKFAEDVKGGTIDLNLDVQTRNKLPERRPRGRPLKTPIVVSTNAAALLVDAEAEIQLPPQAENAKVQPEIPEAGNLSGSRQVQTAEPLLAGPLNTLAPRRFIHVAISKRERDLDTDDNDEDSYRNKISKANIALILALATTVDPDKDKEDEEIAQVIIYTDL